MLNKNSNTISTTVLFLVLNYSPIIFGQALLFSITKKMTRIDMQKENKHSHQLIPIKISSNIYCMSSNDLICPTNRAGFQQNLSKRTLCGIKLFPCHFWTGIAFFGDKKMTANDMSNKKNIHIHIYM